jgi:16S rRNA (guanine966-N2)-methyltransferase
MEPFGLAFLDPPYGKGLADTALAGLADGGWLKANAICVVEERAETPFTPPPALQKIDTRIYGDTAVHILKFVPGRDAVNVIS